MISAVILTKNVENNIIRCLKSLEWCDEIIVIDDFSTDKTPDIIKKYFPKVKTYQNKMNGDFSGQRNFGLEKAEGEWVLFVDGDEEVSDKLKNEIQNSINNNISGYFIKRTDYFLGRWLKFGETGDLFLLRLAHKNKGVWKGKVHEIWEVGGKVDKLKNPLLHYPHPTISEFLEKINLYSSGRAEELYKSGDKTNYISIILYPLGKFIYNYFVKLGFLDGMPGLILAIIMCFHSFLVRSKLFLLESNK